MGYCEFGNTPFILSQNIKLIYNSLINDNMMKNNGFFNEIFMIIYKYN